MSYRPRHKARAPLGVVSNWKLRVQENSGRTLLRSATVQAMVCVIFFVVAYVVVSTRFVDELQMVPPDPAPAEVDVEDVLMSGRDCWSGDDAGSALPSTAVAALPGEAPSVVSSTVGFAIWEGDIEGELYAFCR